MKEAHARTNDSCEANSALLKLTASQFETEPRRKLTPDPPNCPVFHTLAPPCLRRQLSRAASFSRLRPRQ